MTATSAAATEHGNVLLMIGPDDPDGDSVYRALTADEAVTLAKALADAAVESRPAPCNKPMHKACTCIRPRDHDGPCNCLSRDGSEVVGRGIGRVSGE